MKRCASTHTGDVLYELLIKAVEKEKRLVCVLHHKNDEGRN